MRNTSYHLPILRLKAKLARRRKALFSTLLSLKEKLCRGENALSLTLRHVFEHKRIKGLIGGNLALLLVASSFIPNPTEAREINIEPMVIASEDTPLRTERGMQYPIKKVVVNQGYRFFHPGIDFDGEKGDPVFPAMAGTIETIQFSKYAYGNAIIIDHGNNFKTLYAHLSKIEVEKNQKVDFKTEIGEVGSTGHSTGPHLHFEAIDQGVRINPNLIFPKNL